MQGSPRPHVPCPAGSAVSRGTGLGRDNRRRSHPRKGSGRGRGRAVANRPQPCARPAAVQGPAGSLASARRLRSAWWVQGARAHERHSDPRPLTARFAQGGPPASVTWGRARCQGSSGEAHLLSPNSLWAPEPPLLASQRPR